MQKKNSLIIKSEALPQWLVSVASSWRKALKPKQPLSPQVRRRARTPEAKGAYQPRPELAISNQLTRSNNRLRDEQSVRRMVYASSLAALGVGMAKVDGHITPAEKRMVVDHVAEWISPLEAFSLTSEACKETIKLHHYCTRLLTYFADDKPLLRDVCNFLLNIAEADKPLLSEEIIFAEAVSKAFSLPPSWFIDLLRIRLIPLSTVPHEVLNVAPGADAALIKKHYRERMAAFHPDRFMQCSEEVRNLAVERMMLLKEAYTALNALKAA